jgi:16S rRNA processing protein RimM
MTSTRSDATSKQGRRICVARIGAAHGLRGEVRLNSFTADPMAVASYGVLQDADGQRSFEIENCRPSKGVLIARFKGIADRTAAERLCNVDLYVPRDRLPAPEADEFYHADLIGLSAVGRDGAPVGTVVAIHDFGAGDLLEIAPAGGGPTLMLPFTDTVVPTIDIAGRRLVVVPPESDSEGEPR